MSALGLAALILAGEAMLAAWIVPAVVLRRRRRVAVVEQADAQSMIEQVSEAEPSRRDALATIFSSTYQLEGEELEQRVEEFISREQAFYQVMTSVYLERDSARLKEIPEELTKVISPWLRMTPRAGADADSLAELESEKAALSEELDETRRNMDELMAEYRAAFDKAAALEERSAAGGEAQAEDSQDDQPGAADDAVAADTEALADGAPAAEASASDSDSDADADAVQADDTAAPSGQDIDLAADDDEFDAIAGALEEDAQASADDAAPVDASGDETAAEAMEPVAGDQADTDAGDGAQVGDDAAAGDAPAPIDIAEAEAETEAEAGNDVEAEATPAAEETAPGADDALTQDELDKLFEAEIEEMEQA